MTSVGIIGGLGPESTIDYYRRILDAWQRERPHSAPSIVIDSVDVTYALSLVDDQKPALVEYLLASLSRLHGAGVDFAALTANTPHIVFDELAARSPLPLVSIVETCAQEAVLRDRKRLGLLGTRFTMNAPFYTDVFARHGLTIVTPEADDVTWVHDHYIGELLEGVFTAETKAGFVAVIERLKGNGVDAIILGGTELPLLLNDKTVAGLPLLDTTELHVAAIMRRLLTREHP